MVDLDAYFARIAYDGPREPTLATLEALQRLHPAAIPFEAIDVLLDRGIDISPQAVDAKLIAGRRGGYCFEQNALFKRVLTALGFQVEGLIGRVVWMAPPDAPARPRTHMALRVTIDGEPWLADVGFGSAVLTAPLRLGVQGPQETPHDTYRLIPFERGLILQADVAGTWSNVYELSEEPQLDVDYELGNWFTAKHPTSHFRHTLIAARSTGEGRFGLLNNRLTHRRKGEAPQHRMLDADGIEQALKETFGLPVEPEWRPAIERAAAVDGV